MGMANEEIFITMDANTSNAITNIQNLSSSLKSLEGQVKKIAASVKASFSGMTSATDALGASMLKRGGLNTTERLFAGIPKSVGEMKASFGGITTEMAGLNNITGVLNLSTNKLIKSGSNATMISAAFKEVGKHLGSMNASASMAQKQIDKLNKTKLTLIKQAVSNLKAALLGIGMSSLFLGMQVAAAFTGIARGAVDAFLKIRASAGPTNDAISMLGASINFLQFAIGDAIASALEPFLPMLMSIIENVVEWISQNKELTAAIILGGIALGTVMLLGGQFLILASSMIAVVQFLANVLGIKGLTGALTKLTFAEATSGLILLAGKLVIAAAAIVIIYNIIQFAIKGFDSFNKTGKKSPDILSKIADVLGLVANALTTAGAFLALGALSIGVILAYIVREAQYRIGQFVDILSAGGELAFNSLKFAVITGVNGILGALETFIKSTEVAVNAFITLINSLIAAWNAVSGNKIKPLEYADFSDLNIGRIEQDNVALVDSFIKLKSAMDGMGESENLEWLNNKLADFKGLFDQSMSDIWNPTVDLKNTESEIKGDMAVGTEGLQSSNALLTTSLDSLASTISATAISSENKIQPSLDVGGTMTIGTMEVSLPNVTDVATFTEELRDMQSDLELKSNGITESN